MDAFITPRAHKPKQEMCMDALITPYSQGASMKEDTDKTWIGVHGGYAKDMTLRDHFAGLAMQALIPLWHAEHRAGQLGQTGMEDWDGFYEDFSSQAYDMADEMLAVKQSREAK